jgi:hypothetical protein
MYPPGPWEKENWFVEDGRICFASSSLKIRDQEGSELESTDEKPIATLSKP